MGKIILFCGHYGDIFVQHSGMSNMSDSDKSTQSIKGLKWTFRKYSRLA